MKLGRFGAPVVDPSAPSLPFHDRNVNTDSLQDSIGRHIRPKHIKNLENGVEPQITRSIEKPGQQFLFVSDPTTID
jgi:hypothetical protein